MLNPTVVDNYLLRHSSANTSLNESNSFEPLIDNHDDLFSMIEQAGITFGKTEILLDLIGHWAFRCINGFIINRSIGQYQWLSFL